MRADDVIVAPTLRAILLEYCGWVALAMFFFAGSVFFSDEPTSYRWGPALWPQMIAAAVALAATAQFMLAASAVRKAGRLRSAHRRPRAIRERAKTVRTIGSVLLLIAFVVALRSLGFFVATPLFVAGCLTVAGERRPLVIITATAIIAVAIILAFTGLFYVPLPLGALWPFDAASAALLTWLR